MERTSYLAIDLGASSGRALVGCYEDGLITLDEMHRFKNEGTMTPDGLCWDFDGLLANIEQGVKMASETYGKDLISMGVDTWGVDYGIIDAQGQRVGPTYCYRDDRVDTMLKEAFSRFTQEELYANTGIQTMSLNTVFQVLSEVLGNSGRLAEGNRLLFMPDLINHHLTGVAACEYSIASTSQMMDMSTGAWSKKVLQALNIPEHMFAELVQPGTLLGEVRPELAESLNVKHPLNLIAVGGHDTASAVVAVPTDKRDYAYLSSGTWSLMGLEADQALISDASFEHNLTNEGGVSGTIRFLKNITGLWIVQECQREWAEAGEDIGFGELAQMAADSTPFMAVIDVDHAPFLKPGDMPEKIKAYCRDSGQTEPQSKGEIIRVVLEGLALKYRITIELLDEFHGSRIPTLHIIGGGIQNKLLNQLTADATGRKVITGPVEATALGNIVMQMIATGDLNSLQSGRDLVAASFPVDVYESKASDALESASVKLASLLA